jgi:hypothetical protein
MLTGTGIKNRIQQYQLSTGTGTVRYWYIIKHKMLKALLPVCVMLMSFK